MRIAVAGGTGFIGGPLCRALQSQGNEILVLTRSPERVPAGLRALHWNGRSAGPWRQALEGCRAVVNLAGEPIVAGRWTSSRKQVLRDSRIESTRALVEAFADMKQPPQILINASAIGYYGGQGDEACEESTPPGDDFLAHLCVDWETEALKAKSSGVRVVNLRLGIVLADDGGALAKMIPPFRFFAGGPLGSGTQWMSWISREDILRLIRHALDSDLEGPLNAVAPNALSNAEFSRALGASLHRPSWLPVPETALRLLLGEMAEMLLTGRRVLPRKALDSGFKFSRPDLPSALSACLP